MEKWFAFNSDNLIAVVLTAVGIYTAIILFTRLAGKRSFSKMSSFDFAITVSIGSMIATTVLSKSVSLWEGITGLAILYLLQMVVGIFRRFGIVRTVVDNKPLLLMEGEHIYYENLKKARVTEADLKSKLREANVIELSEIKAVVFESTGDISVLRSSDENKNLAAYLREGIQK
ncbi:DUF421 domain-containing protein [Christiangramia aquimixticola]|uniref:DUF421 domain-containing protein n=1 Tax=Christiangramia aquimixticola TaxID=1697558 RepID=UPI003AA8D37A